jgi:hypothetical protein
LAVMAIRIASRFLFPVVKALLDTMSSQVSILQLNTCTSP